MQRRAPLREIIEGHSRHQACRDFLILDAEFIRHNLRGLTRACERARRQMIDRVDLGLEPARDLFHPATAFLCQRAEIVGIAGDREFVAIHCHAMADDQELHFILVE
jgi:hypothetical protein